MQVIDFKSSFNKEKDTTLIDNMKSSLFNYKISIKSNKKTKTSKDCTYKVRKLTYFVDNDLQNNDKLQNYSFYREEQLSINKNDYIENSNNNIGSSINPIFSNKLSDSSVSTNKFSKITINTYLPRTVQWIPDLSFRDKNPIFSLLNDNIMKIHKVNTKESDFYYLPHLRKRTNESSRKKIEYKAEFSETKKFGKDYFKINLFMSKYDHIVKTNNISNQLIILLNTLNKSNSLMKEYLFENDSMSNTILIDLFRTQFDHDALIELSRLKQFKIDYFQIKNSGKIFINSKDKTKQTSELKLNTFIETFSFFNQCNMKDYNYIEKIQTEGGLIGSLFYDRVSMSLTSLLASDIDFLKYDQKNIVYRTINNSSKLYQMIKELITSKNQLNQCSLFITKTKEFYLIGGKNRSIKFSEHISNIKLSILNKNDIDSLYSNLKLFTEMKESCFVLLEVSNTWGTVMKISNSKLRHYVRLIENYDLFSFNKAEKLKEEMISYDNNIITLSQEIKSFILNRENKKLEEENQNKQLKDENFVIRRKNKSSAADDAKVDEDDFLTKNHSDILGEALKNRFEMKLNKKASGNNLYLNKTTSTQSITNNKQNYLEDLDEDISPILLNDLWESKMLEQRFFCRIFDKNTILYIVNERYLIFHEVENEYSKEAVNVNNLFELLTDEVEIKGKFKGIVLLRKINNEYIKSKYKELEISFNDESLFNLFLLKISELIK